MTKYNIPISRPNLTPEDLAEIKKCFDSSWISSKSPWVDRFEAEFAKKVSGTKYAASVNSGTSALFLALKAVGVGPGDEVIIPTLTMIATVNAVSLAGAKSVVVDSRSHDDWNIDPSLIEKSITAKTKVILPVHLYGYPCEMEEIMKIAKKHKLFVIEDAAEAMGTLYKGLPVGGIGDIGCFSLYSNKIMTTGNGGMVTTNDKNIYRLLKKLEFFDFNEENHFRHNHLGYNFVLSGLQAALGLSQTRRFGKLIAKRRQVFAWYKKHLSGKVRLINPPSFTKPNFWFPAIIAESQVVKNKIFSALTKKGIETRNFFLPVHRQPVYRDQFDGEKHKISDYFFERGLLLPSFYDLTESEVVVVCRVIEKAS